MGANVNEKIDTIYDKIVNGVTLTFVGTISGNTTIDLSGKTGYENLTVDDFVYCLTKVQLGATSRDDVNLYINTSVDVTPNYDPSTGVFSITNSYFTFNTIGGGVISAPATLSFSVYCTKDI